MRRLRQPSARVPDIVDHVEPLEEGHAVDEVQAEPRRGPEVVNDEIDSTRDAADRCVELNRGSKYEGKRQLLC